MKIFISWSGKETASYRVAKILKEILPLMFQGNEYFFSDHIQKGTFALNEIFNNLSEAKIGIICITKKNIIKPWLLFESGALSTTVNKNNGLALPLLIDITKDEFAASANPLSGYQGTSFTDHDDFLRFLNDINSKLNTPLSEKQVEIQFNAYKEKIYSVDLSTTEVSSEEIMDNGVRVEISDIYKMKADEGGYDYIFRISFYNSNEKTAFISDMVIEKSGNKLQFKKEVLPLMTNTSRTNNVVTDVKKLMSHIIPFKADKGSIETGYFNLYDSENMLSINEGDDFIIDIDLGTYHIRETLKAQNIKHWDKLDF